ncbi:MAG: hypothetical protein ACREOF_21345 [Gemmatimonadales bacterium]
MAEPTTAAPTPGPAAPKPGGKQALLEAAQEVVRRQAEQRRAELDAAQRQRSRISPIIAVGSAVILVIVAYLTVERPTWLFPKPPVAESSEVREASLRIGMASAAQRIEKFRQTRNRLPRTLAETGGVLRGIRYERTDSLAYTLRGNSGDLTLTFRSTDSLKAFVGGSFQVIARRSGR